MGPVTAQQCRPGRACPQEGPGHLEVGGKRALLRCPHVTSPAVLPSYSHSSCPKGLTPIDYIFQIRKQACRPPSWEAAEPGLSRGFFPVCGAHSSTAAPGQASAGCQPRRHSYTMWLGFHRGIGTTGTDTLATSLEHPRQLCDPGRVSFLPSKQKTFSDNLQGSDENPKRENGLGS